MRCLGIDYGEKRIGLAFGDDLGVATPLPAATAPKKKERLAHIMATIAERQVDRIIIGYPLNMNGTVGFKAQEVDAFVGDLAKRTTLPIIRLDERLTSHQAASGMRAMNRKDDRKSGTLDSRAAALILQDYLDQQTPAMLESGENGDAVDEDCR